MNPSARAHATISLRPSHGRLGQDILAFPSWYRGGVTVAAGDLGTDGKAEVVYSDQNRLRIYEGPTGDVLLERCNTTATLIEYPVIADVDNDGQADIVVVSNAYGKNDPSINCVEDGVSALGEIERLRIDEHVLLFEPQGERGRGPEPVLVDA